jgi:hypothetical protein
MGDREQNREKNNDPSKAESLKEGRHDYLGQPFMRRPFQWRRMKRVRIVRWHMPALQNDFAGFDVVSGIAVTEQPVPDTEYQNKKHRNEYYIADRREQER